jgi:hypothetical protein
MSVKRYGYDSNGYFGRKTQDGDYVEYSDYASLLAVLRQCLEAMEGILSATADEGDVETALAAAKAKLEEA